MLRVHLAHRETAYPGMLQTKSVTHMCSVLAVQSFPITFSQKEVVPALINAWV